MSARYVRAHRCAGTRGVHSGRERSYLLAPRAISHCRRAQRPRGRLIITTYVPGDVQARADSLSAGGTYTVKPAALATGQSACAVWTRLTKVLDLHQVVREIDDPIQEGLTVG